MVRREAGAPHVLAGPVLGRRVGSPRADGHRRPRLRTRADRGAHRLEGRARSPVPFTPGRLGSARGHADVASSGHHTDPVRVEERQADSTVLVDALSRCSRLSSPSAGKWTSRTGDSNTSRQATGNSEVPGDSVRRDVWR